MSPNKLIAVRDDRALDHYVDLTEDSRYRGVESYCTRCSVGAKFVRDIEPGENKLFSTMMAFVV